MHELSLATSLVEQAEDIAKQNNGTKVSSVTIRVGGMSGVDRDAFEFCYPEATQGTMLENSKLSIEMVPLKISCHSCLKESSPEAIYIVCEHCGSDNVSITQGKEFQLINMELE